jgi:O-antigen/teichoic acid export membrane protein
LKQKLKQIFRNQFLKNVSTLAFGTLISQGLVVASSPLLTRLFSVEAFGILSVFTSITVFFAVVSTGRYELAIGLPEKDRDALKIIKLILFLGLGISVFYFLLILFLKYGIDFQDKSGFLLHNTSLLAPLYIFFIAVYSALSYWNQRKKKYKLISISNAVQVIVATIFSIIFGFLGFQEGMIWSLVIGIFAGCLFILIKEKLFPKIWSQKERLLPVAKEYQSFPRYMILSDLSLTASQQFIPILFSILYSTTVVGFFAMANRMLRLPNIVITTSIGNVFRNDAIDEIRKTGDCKNLYKSTFKKLIFMSLPIYSIVFIIAPYLFEILFGEVWLEAGYYARIIALFLFIEFIATPLNTLFYVKEKQKLLMRIQILNAFLGGFLIYLGAITLGSARISLMFYTANAVFFNILLLYFSYKIASNKL